MIMIFYCALVSVGIICTKNWWSCICHCAVDNHLGCEMRVVAPFFKGFITAYKFKVLKFVKSNDGKHRKRKKENKNEKWSRRTSLLEFKEDHLLYFNAMSEFDIHWKKWSRIEFNENDKVEGLLLKVPWYLFFL